MRSLSVNFTAPRQVVVESETLAKPEPDQVTVQSIVSAISAGTELLFYRGQVPASMPIDTAIETLGSGPSGYPMRYGYACVGQVVDLGHEVDADWLGRKVFVFHPHQSHFNCSVANLLPVAPGLSMEQCALLPNMETAVNFVMDGRPVIGERVAVVGLGVVGLLTVTVLAQFPLAELAGVDPMPERQNIAGLLGATALIGADVDESASRQFDLTFEVSGSPSALNTALALTGYAGRVIIGSWYGTKTAPIALGGDFHRSRIKLKSSQVSSLDPRWSGRWDKSRRMDVAWEMLHQVDGDHLITHRFPITEAVEAYRLLDEAPQEALQVVFTYPSN